jgi:hypothetical protein
VQFKNCFYYFFDLQALGIGPSTSSASAMPNGSVCTGNAVAPAVGQSAGGTEVHGHGSWNWNSIHLADHVLPGNIR